MIRFTEKYIFIVIGVFAIGIIASQVFFSNGKPKFTIAEAKLGNVLQTVSETGIVKSGEAIDLGFKTSGKIQKIYVKAGDKVAFGQSLAKLETNNLYFQYQDAEVGLVIAQAKLNKLLTGATQEELAVYQTQVQTAQIALDTANKNLTDAYQSALNTIDDSYLKSYNASETVKIIQRTYFNSYDQQGVKVIENKNIMDLSLVKTKSYLDAAKLTNANSDIDTAVSDMQRNLTAFSQSLAIIRQACEESIYWNTVSSTDKTSIDTQRTNINTAITNTATAQQSISTKKLAINSAQGSLDISQSQLNLNSAQPRQEDIDLYKAQVSEAQNQVGLSETQIADSTIKSPVAGTITKINNREGEVSQGTVISMLPDEPFQIEVNIYEEDVVKLQIGNSVDISLIAFPDQKFSGKVIEIDPAEKLINDVVYYRTKVVFDLAPSGLRPGMTADLIIKTNSRENVLYISKDAVTEKNSKKLIEVLDDKNQIQEREIKTGLEGSDGNVEVISGLQNGEKVIIE